MNTLGKGVNYSSCVWCAVGCVLEMYSRGGTNTVDRNF